MMTVVHHDDPNGIPVTPKTLATGQFSLGVSPVVLGLDSKPIFETCVRIDILRPGNDASPYPIKALLTTVLKEIQKVDPSNVILPINPASKHGALMLTSDIPADENGVTRYFGGFQDAFGRSPTANKTLRVFVRIRSAQSLCNLKFNMRFSQWLKDNKLFVHTHGFRRRTMLAPPVLSVGCLLPFTAVIRSLTFLSARLPNVHLTWKSISC